MNEIKREGDRAVLKPGEDIVSAMAEKILKSELQELLSQEIKELEIDMSTVGMIDSIGLGVLIATHNTLSKSGGKLKVSHVSEEIYDLFKTMSLDRHFDVQAAE